MATQMDNLARKQIYIPAARPQEELALRVAAYCRVSSDSEDQLNSFAAQTTHYHQLIANHESWLLVDIYADEGITGTSAQKRKDFQRLLADCRKGKIDKILVKSISRFARNTTDCLETIRELRSLGISVFFEEHNIDTKLMGSEMLTAVLASCAQTESESISKNTRWGVQKRMAQGTYIASSAPYGFRLVDGILVIQQDEAAVIRRIFDAYLIGFTPAEIADRLNGTGNTDRSWWESTVKYILRNERYTGNAVFQKTYTTDTLPFQRKKNNGEHVKYSVTNTNPAIIPLATFEAAQMRIQEQFKLRQAKPGQLPLAGKVICGRCGAACVVRYNKGKEYISCRTHDYGADKCALKPIRAEEICSAFFRFYDNLKHNPGILQIIVEKLNVVRKRQMLWHPDVVAVNKRISDIVTQSHRLAGLNRRQLVDPDIFISKSNQLAEQLRQAKQQKEKLQEQEDNTILESTLDLQDVLRDGPDFLDAFEEELFCELIDKVIVDSNTRIRFRLKNGLELPESIRRTVR